LLGRQRLVHDQPVVDRGALRVLSKQVVDRIVAKLDMPGEGQVVVLHGHDRLAVAVVDLGIAAAQLRAHKRMARELRVDDMVHADHRVDILDRRRAQRVLLPDLERVAASAYAGASLPLLLGRLPGEYSRMHPGPHQSFGVSS
jgi:hypothetical protein